MGLTASPDPSWRVTDLFERSRSLAASTGSSVGDPVVRRHVTTQALDLQRRCAELDVAAMPLRRRHRPRVGGALTRLADAVDDLTAVVLMSCEDASRGRQRIESDVDGLLDRIGERHDYVVGLLRRTGSRRTHMSS